ncbi:maleylpyruvate isomerase mycothiol-dependent enzyme family protein [Gulosibacter molinativorax]|nr:hypothetical protein [Gulosibacter molinativorax]
MSIKKANQVAKETFADEIRATIGSRKHNVGVTPRETLVDALVHPQDIAIPLGREMPMDALAAATAAERVWSYQGKGLARVFRNLPLWHMRLVATDIDWSVDPLGGTVGAPEIRGPIAELLLLLTGRTVAFDRVEGEGLLLLQRER